jgi:NAD+ diphosphatase
MKLKLCDTHSFYLNEGRYMSNFVISSKPKLPDADSKVLLIVISNNDLLYDKDENKILFTTKDLFLDVFSIAKQLLYLGNLGENEIYAYTPRNVEKFQNLNFVYARNLLDKVDAYLHIIIFRSLQLCHWDKRSKFCGCCGNETHLSRAEYVKECGREECEHKMYPQYSPAVIMLVWRGDEILLGRSPHFEAGMYSTLAGFVEAGETCEKAVIREIHEEVSIDVHNVEHHSVQPWPFPNSLMFGYFAEYKSGALNINHEELEDARWFHYKKLPKLPPKSTISTRLIYQFVENREKKFRKSCSPFALSNFFKSKKTPIDKFSGKSLRQGLWLIPLVGLLTFKLGVNYFQDKKKQIGLKK